MDISSIDQIIMGGESGPGARPIHPDWVRSVRDQCQAAGVAFFFKGWGAWAPTVKDPTEWGENEIPLLPDGFDCRGYETLADADLLGAVLMRRVGKKAAGRMLDGREWNEIPGDRG